MVVLGQSARYGGSDASRCSSPVLDLCQAPISGGVFAYSRRHRVIAGVLVTRQPIRDSLHFLSGLVRHPKKVGAVLPSSRYLAEAMVEGLDLHAGDTIVEYGPGTGPMTRVIAEKIGNGMRYLGIERDPEFHSLLTRRFPQLDFHLGSAEQIGKILKERGFCAPKVIISGLPFASFSATVQQRLAKRTREALAPQGQFRTFQYVHAYGLPSARRFRAMMNRQFERFECSAPVYRNVPPAFGLIYCP